MGKLPAHLPKGYVFGCLDASKVPLPDGADHCLKACICAPAPHDADALLAKHNVYEARHHHWLKHALRFTVSTYGQGGGGVSRHGCDAPVVMHASRRYDTSEYDRLLGNCNTDQSTSRQRHAMSPTRQRTAHGVGRKSLASTTMDEVIGHIDEAFATMKVRTVLQEGP